MKKTYHPPATPCERLLEHPLVEKSTKEALRKQLMELDPVTLLHGIRQGQSALAALSQGDTRPGSTLGSCALCNAESANGARAWHEH
jgi:hypothetical protein